MYRLTRDDGAELRLGANLWESALELAYLFGWKPSGTETPHIDVWREQRPGYPAAAWDRGDYFSRAAQRVGTSDARALSEAVLRALRRVPEGSSSGEDPRAPLSPVPSRASAVSEGLSVAKRRLLQRVAAFAAKGGFTIGSSA
jgi:hypothetical protein